MTQGRTHAGRPRQPSRQPGRGQGTARQRPRPAARPAARRPVAGRPAVRRPRKSLRGAALVRLRVAFVIIAMVVSVFAVRLFELQGLDASAYAARAASEGVTRVTLPASRGEIKDRSGVPLAESVDGLMIVADPTMTTPHAREIATILARRLGVDYVDVLERLRKPDTRFQYLARRVPATEARAVVAEVESHHWSGLDVRRDPVRAYPSKDVAANLVGFLNDQGDAAEGFELNFNTLLSGKDGSATYETGGGNRIPLGDTNIVPARSGHDLTLTLDRDVQWYTQRVLRDAVQGSGGDWGSAVVMDSQTGELLALADYPSFDASRPSSAGAGTMGARSVLDAYEPGSVEKILTTSALIDAHKVTPQTQIVVPPFVRSNDRVIHDDVAHGTWHLTLTGVLAKSSNIGTVLADRQFKKAQLHAYLRKFGLGRPTGLGVYGESAGLLPAWKHWAQVEQDTIAFGQGVAVSAVQMAAAVNTIANGGVYVQPSIVKGRATTNAGVTVGSDTSGRHRVVSTRAAALETRMMEAVVGPGGTGPLAAIDGYRVAGKTGTAERVNPRCRCYDGSHTVSFAGFAPADKPRFLVYVVVDRPTNGGFGGTVAAPAWQKVMSYVLQKYAVPPTGSRSPKAKLTW